MKIPKQVKIGGHIFTVLYPYSFRERTDQSGQCDWDFMQIKIAEQDRNEPKKAQTRIEEILIHEVLHAIDWVYNGNSLTETTTDQLAQGLYQVIKDNPKLFNS